jgi:hypothetical protein
MFEERVFPEVLEEVVLLLAEGTGGASYFEVHQTRDFRTLEAVDAARWTEHTPGDNEKWTPALVAHDALERFRELVNDGFETLAEWGGAYLGAVTGNNGFFSLSLSDAQRHGLTDDDVIRISPPGSRHLRGLTFTDAAWTQLARDGARCLLLYPKKDPSPAAERYIAGGKAKGVENAYKCRVRKPWWRVPLVDPPDVFLTYMNHDRPRLVTNAAGAHILNSLYGIRLAASRRQLGSELLPPACLNSVTLLGSEIVGRAYGGGLLKMEPREADKLPVPSLQMIKQVENELRNIGPQLAISMRSGDLVSAVDVVDGVLLSHVSATDLKKLRLAREHLFHRRRARRKSVEG